MPEGGTDRLRSSAGSRLSAGRASGMARVAWLIGSVGLIDATNRSIHQDLHIVVLSLLDSGRASRAAIPGERNRPARDGLR